MEERNNLINRSGAPYYEICYGCEKGTHEDDLDMIIVKGNPGLIPCYFHPNLECRKEAMAKIDRQLREKNVFSYLIRKIRDYIIGI